MCVGLCVPVVSVDVRVSWFMYIFAHLCVEAEERKRERVCVCVRVYARVRMCAHMCFGGRGL